MPIHLKDSYILQYLEVVEIEALRLRRQLLFLCAAGHPEDDSGRSTAGSHLHRLPEQAAAEGDDRFGERDHSSPSAEQGHGRFSHTIANNTPYLYRNSGK